ncbi:ParA family protein [Nanchangia anserum]|uniref:ParA family protein n=1 Tax=Nanchangia anserum TaxID=2692125 RepID=A0A8I0KNY4_9ACTO|nr:AAA family ATPase [Nanchangia anserum]MBD3689781.1 ParA family protein [Nanchangia anserum]QOX81955.1 ParA family protein [Nanchangia anserum]
MSDAPLVMALCNQKGGVGKSTTAYHLARAGVVAGMSVLVVDMDPQGNLTNVASKELLAETAPGVADVLSARTRLGLGDVIVPGLWEGLDVAPTMGESLALVRDELVIAGAGRERRLTDELGRVGAGYDLVLIDCAPSLDQLTINALTAADVVVVVTQARLWSANGLVRLLDTVHLVREAYNPRLRVGGVIVNAHETLTRSGRHWHDELIAASQSADLALLAPPIPKRTLIADACEASQALDEQGNLGAELAGIYTDHLATLMGGEH